MVRCTGARGAWFPRPARHCDPLYIHVYRQSSLLYESNNHQKDGEFLLQCGNLPTRPGWTHMQTAPRLVSLLLFGLLALGSTARADDDNATLKHVREAFVASMAAVETAPVRAGRRRFRGTAALSALPVPAGRPAQPATGVDPTRGSAARQRHSPPARRRDRRVPRAAGRAASDATAASRRGWPTSPRDRPGRRTSRNTGRTATRSPRCVATGSPRASPRARPMAWRKN